MADPEQAARELERCVKDLKFVRALIDHHVDGDFHDSEAYRVDPMATIMRNTKGKRVLYSCDFPFKGSENAIGW